MRYYPSSFEAAQKLCPASISTLKDGWFLGAGRFYSTLLNQSTVPKLSKVLKEDTMKIKINWSSFVIAILLGVIVTLVARDLQGWIGMYDDSIFTNQALYLLGNKMAALPVAFAVGAIISIRKKHT